MEQKVFEKKVILSGKETLVKIRRLGGYEKSVIDSKITKVSVNSRQQPEVNINQAEAKVLYIYHSVVSPKFTIEQLKSDDFDWNDFDALYNAVEEVNKPRKDLKKNLSEETPK